jgi:AcrR family transcriptional regulator
MVNRYRDAAHRQMLDAALDAAAAEVVQRGWQGLRMRAIAEEVGVSRQTLYNAFSDRHGLASALMERLVDRFLSGVERAVGERRELRAQWAAAFRFTLDTAANEPLLKVVLAADGTDELLPLLTTGGAPIITAAKARLTAAFLATHPDLDPAALDVVSETVTRLALSHIVLPLDPAETVAERVADLAARYLEPRA